jgi:hypothetical protein
MRYSGGVGGSICRRCYGDARGCCYNAPIIHVYHLSGF